MMSAQRNIMLKVSSEPTTATGGQRTSVGTAIRMRPVLRLDQARPHGNRAYLLRCYRWLAKR